jgi:hypothetical protein
MAERVGDRMTEAPDGIPERPPRRGGVSMLPAFVVAGIGLVLVLVFGIGALLTSSPSGTTSTATTHPAHRPVPGTGLVAVPARAALQPILTAGEPPTNIVSATTVPRGWVREGVQRNLNSTDQYSKGVTLRVPVDQASLITFYRHELRAHGWRLLSTSSTAGHGVEILAQLGGSDGWYWEAGVTVSATTFAQASGQGGAQATGTQGGTASSQRSAAGESTRFSLTLVQESDDF